MVKTSESELRAADAMPKMGEVQGGSGEMRVLARMNEQPQLPEQPPVIRLSAAQIRVAA